MYGRVHRMKRMVKQVENEETRKKKKDAEKRKTEVDLWDQKENVEELKERAE